MRTTSPKTSSSSSYEFPTTSRRVSFDLSHNKVHVLPTLEECRDAAKQRSREEWQRRTLNEDMLSEDIIVEIQEDCSASSRCSSSDEDEKELAEKPVIEIKSCLKKPPVVVATTPASKKNNSKKNQKKRKRSHSKSSSHIDVSNAISVH